MEPQDLLQPAKIQNFISFLGEINYLFLTTHVYEIFFDQKINLSGKKSWKGLTLFIAKCSPSNLTLPLYCLGVIKFWMISSKFDHSAMLFLYNQVCILRTFLDPSTLLTSLFPIDYFLLNLDNWVVRNAIFVKDGRYV